MKRSFLKYLIFIFLISSAAIGKEIFTFEHLEKYLTKDNPYIYSAIGQQYVDEAHITTAEGTFDTVLSADYDKKEYPVSTGEFGDISLSKPIENGMEFLVGYRKAEGVQEYNNIKTGIDGELRIGIKVPVFSLLNDMNTRKYKVDAAKINAGKSTFEAQDNIRNLYANIGNAYYQLLYVNELLKLEKRLLDKAKKRNQFINKRVASGDLPQIAMLESEQHIIGREQRVLMTRNHYYKALQTCLKYMNMSQDKFERNYILPAIKRVKNNKIILEKAMNSALKNRPDLKALESKKAKLDLDAEYNALAQYPNLNVFAYGVHDIYYGEGVKVGLKLDIPLERRGYEGKKLEIQKGLDQIEESKNKLRLDLKANLSYLLYSLEIVDQNIKLGQKEIKIVEELEKVENKKYAIGSSDLFQVNQREMVALAVKQKQLEYTINALLVEQELKREIGEFLDI